MIVIDGEQFKIDVLSVKRSADFLDKYAERLANGHLRRELLRKKAEKNYWKNLTANFIAQKPART